MNLFTDVVSGLAFLAIIFGILFLRLRKSWYNFEPTMGTFWLLFSSLFFIFADPGPLNYSAIDIVLTAIITLVLIVLNLQFLIAKRKELSGNRMVLAVLRLFLYIIFGFVYFITNH
jgi:hypothetical protein